MQKIEKDFLEFEKKLFERKFLGVNYWQLIRHNVAANILCTATPGINRRENTKRIFGMVKLIGISCKRLIHLKRTDVLYFDSRNYRTVDGILRDTNLDYWNFEKETSITKCYYDKNDIGNWEQGYEADLNMPETIFELFAFLSKHVNCIFRDKKEESFIAELVDNLNEEFGTEYDFNTFLKMVRNSVIHYKVLCWYYNKLLKKMSPKAILVVCHYDDRLFPLYDVARIYHIPTIELQHGVSANHVAYNYFDIENKGKKLPDYMFTYGEFWHNYMRVPSCMKLLPIGNPFLEARKRKYEGVVPDDKKIVFFSDEITGREQAKMAVELWKRVHSEGYVIQFKPHPLEGRFISIYEKLFNGTEIELISLDEEVYGLLAKSKHHVSVFSTVMYESLIFENTKRYILFYEEYLQYMKFLFDEGYAFLINSVEEMEKKLKVDIMGSVSSEEVWKANARENGKKALLQIMNRVK